MHEWFRQGWFFAVCECLGVLRFAGVRGKFIGLAHLVFDVRECLVGVCGWVWKDLTPIKNQFS